MTFNEEEKLKWYSNFWMSESGYFCIGIENMLFGRMRIQVMHRRDKKITLYADDDSGWFVIREYVTYVPIVCFMRIQEIISCLEFLPEDVNPDDWKHVEMCLPEKVEKYLEDEEQFRKVSEDYKKNNS